MAITIRPEELICDQRGGKYIYLASGRIPNDDDDSAYLIQAEDEAHAWEIFEATLIEERELTQEDVEANRSIYSGPTINVCCQLVGDITED